MKFKMKTKLNELNIILCSHSNIVRQSISDFLRLSGMHIDYSKELRAVKNNNYSLIIVDADDYPLSELYSLKRMVPSYVGFIVLKSGFNKSELMELKNHGLTNVVMKPFNIKTLKAKIDKVLK